MTAHGFQVEVSEEAGQRLRSRSGYWRDHLGVTGMTQNSRQEFQSVGAYDK